MHSGQFSRYFQDYRALLPYSLLGLIIGLCSAAAIMGFEALIQLLGELWLDDSPDGFENLPAWQRFAFPTVGAFLLGLLFSGLGSEDREVGMVHVISRMHSHYGHLPWRNAVVQFFSGAFALASGQSGGREGPGVHLGASISSSFAGWLGLPNNSRRILIACGTAGSIAAAFNTPLAGVVFAMEVIVVEYTVIGFTPVILAAVSATALHRALDLRFEGLQIPATDLVSLLELPFILMLGIITGAIIALFIMLLKRNLALSGYPVLLRFTLAGVITGTLGLAVPEVLGVGYDSVNLAVQGELAPMLLLTLIIAKVLATACSVGLGLPVGMIGPSLLIGACSGGLLGYWGNEFLPEMSSDPSMYAVIGMGAAMAAVLNAPLAGLLAVVELTRNVSLVFPSMLAIIAATLTVTVLFGQRSAHQTVLRHLQREMPDDPISQMLHQTSIIDAMDRRVGMQAHYLTAPPARAEGAASANASDLPHWCLITRDEDTLFMARGEDIRNLQPATDEEGCDLTEQDLRRWTITNLSPRATLREGLDALRTHNAEAVVIKDPNVAGAIGVLTREMIDQFYLKQF